MTRKRAKQGAAEPGPAKPNFLGQPDDREPKGATSLRRAGGSESRTFNNVLLNAVASLPWLPPSLPEQTKNDRLSAVIHAMMGFKPQDEIEGMIAAQAVAMHHASMECFRRAMIPGQPFEAATRLRKDGASLARGMTEMGWLRWTVSAARVAIKRSGWSTSRCRAADRPLWAM